MYVPPQFREERADVLHAAIRELRLAALATSRPDGVSVTHLPMLLREENGELVLEGHVAIQNEHWRTVGPSVAIFRGPHAYISPGWYESKRAHGKVVPTWNYVAVHVHGQLEAVKDGVWLSRHLDALTDTHETSQAHPWRTSDAPADFITNLQRAIVGLRMKVERIEGAWKMIQHRSAGDRLGAIEGLASASVPGAADVAQVMRELEAQRS
ncbi:FMN-binding negative transcriptional regulator [Terrarubrum flagellatum]|uniref:FMN-binding negative transcriptional regulator n=1 Tax=Terrirubrum flagellatum TaxID=2895980 RepID=UPI003144F919